MMSEIKACPLIKACPFCGGAKICTEKGININYCDNCSAESNIEQWNTRPIEDALNARIAELTAENAVLKSENVNLSKKLTDYGKELRQSYKYDKTCSTCRYLDENRDCVLGIRCVNYTLWQGKIL